MEDAVFISDRSAQCFIDLVLARKKPRTLRMRAVYARRQFLGYHVSLNGKNVTEEEATA
jgi:hypothetical protein